MSLRMLTAPALAALAALVVGCSRSADSSPPDYPTGEEALTYLKATLEHYQREHRRPPAKHDDVIGMEPEFPGVFRALMFDRIVWVWGVPLTPHGKGVVGYETDVSENGGLVLLQDGTMNKMTADEFRAIAPKNETKK
jgi:hypothetical protein